MTEDQAPDIEPGELHKENPTLQAMSITKATVRMMQTQATPMGMKRQRVGEKVVEQTKFWPLSTTLQDIAKYVDARKANNCILMFENGDNIPQDERIDEDALG